MNRRPELLVKTLILVSLAVCLTIIGSRPTGAAQAQGDTRLRIALSTQIQANSVNSIYGPIHYGHDFGVDITKDDFTFFDSHALAVEAALAGQADIVGGSFVAQMVARQSGLDFKTFCPRLSKSDFVLVARSGITKIEQILDPGVRVSVDSPGGVADSALNALFQANHINATTKTMPNIHIIEAAPERVTAMLSNDIDAAMLNLANTRQLQKQIPDLVIVAKLYEEVPLYLTASYAASKDWLDSHLDEATAFCASTIKAGRLMSADYDLYVQGANELLSKPPSDAILREEWALINQNDLWSLQTGLDPNAVRFMSDTMVKAGVLSAPQRPDDMLDLRPYQGALKLLGPYVAPTQQATPADAGSTPEATSAATPNS